VGLLPAKRGGTPLPRMFEAYSRLTVYPKQMDGLDSQGNAR